MIPTYGPYTWEVCERCDYNRHVCGGCGEELTHAQAQGAHYEEYHREEEEKKIDA
jgi:hypothetical protein